MNNEAKKPTNKLASLYKSLDDRFKKTAWGQWNERHKRKIIITGIIEVIVLVLLLAVYFHIRPHHYAL